MSQFPLVILLKITAYDRKSSTGLFWGCFKGDKLDHSLSACTVGIEIPAFVALYLLRQPVLLIKEAAVEHLQIFRPWSSTLHPLLTAVLIRARREEHRDNNSHLKGVRYMFPTVSFFKSCVEIL